MKLSQFFRISPPAAEPLPREQVEGQYRRIRKRTFWGVTAAYSLFYVCRTVLGVVKQPLIDGGILTAAQLGVISSVFMFVYAVGKFSNGFIADYCNVRRFMATGLAVSALVNLLIGVLGLLQGKAALTPLLLFVLFTVAWGINGWVQSMGAPPGVISLSRWFPLRERGIRYSIFSASPYIGKSLTMILVGALTVAVGWQLGFLLAAACGIAGTAMILLFVSDTPESRGLPSIRTLSGEAQEEGLAEASTRILHRQVLRQPAIWVIALSSAFIYITQYAVSNWGVLFLQKAKGFSLESGAITIGVSEFFGIAGTVLAGWLSDRVFRGDRAKPVILSGLLCLAALCFFLFTGGGMLLNILYVSVYSLAIGIVYCIVAGLMALDIVPRGATGAALGIVGISSYAAAGLQDLASGVLIGAGGGGSWLGVSVFWAVACLASFLLPVLGWRHLRG